MAAETETPTSVMVSYNVTLTALVNLETGEVERVIQHEDVLPGSPTTLEREGWAKIDRSGITEAGDLVSGAILDKAYEIAESTEWPAWEMP